MQRVPDTHALSFHPTCMSRILANSQADLVLAVGTRLGELNMWGKPPMFGEPDKQKLIRIDTEPTHIGLNKPTDVPLIGDAKCILSQLMKTVKTLTDKRLPHDKIAELRMIQDEWQKELDDLVADTQKKPMLTGQILTACNEFFNEDAIFVMESMWKPAPIFGRPWSVLSSPGSRPPSCGGRSGCQCGSTG